MSREPDPSSPTDPSLAPPAPSAPGPWYAAGLRFACTQCGNCCTGEPGVVWVDDEELAAIAAYLGTTETELRLLHTRLYARRTSLIERADGDCTFLDGATRRCTIYPVRPRQCRTWPFWNSNLARPEDWQDASRGCPGIDQGRLYALEEIAEQAVVIDV